MENFILTLFIWVMVNIFRFNLTAKSPSSIIFVSSPDKLQLIGVKSEDHLNFAGMISKGSRIRGFKCLM